MHRADKNNYLSKDIWKTFWSFIRGDMPVREFELWIYGSKNLKYAITADLYEEILMLDFSDEKKVNWLRHIVYFFLLEIPLSCLCETFSNRTKIDIRPNDNEDGIKTHKQQQQFLSITKNIKLFNREKKYGSFHIFLNALEICRCQICGTKWLRIFEEVDCDYYLFRLSYLQYNTILANPTWPNKNWPSDLSDLYELLISSCDWYWLYEIRFNSLDELKKSGLNQFMYRFTPEISLLNNEKETIFSWLNSRWREIKNWTETLRFWPRKSQCLRLFVQFIGCFGDFREYNRTLKHFAPATKYISVSNHTS